MSGHISDLGYDFILFFNFGIYFSVYFNVFKYDHEKTPPRGFFEKKITNVLKLRC